MGRYLAIAVLVTSLATNAFLATAYYWSMDQPTKQASAEASQSKNAERQPKRPDLVDTLSGLSNVVMAFFTIALFVAASVSNATSIGAMEESRKANVLAGIAANAAKLAADTAFAAEAPYIAIAGSPEISGARFGVDPILPEYAIRNYGRTPAIIRRIRSDVVLFPHDEDEGGGKPVIGAFHPYDLVVPPGSTVPYKEWSSPGPTPREWDVATRNEGIVFLLLRLQYVDVFGNAYELAARHRVSIVFRGLVESGGRECNYLRRIDAIEDHHHE